MPSPDIKFETHAEAIAPYRRWVEMIVSTAHLVYLSLACGAIYLAIFVGETSSPMRRLVLALILLAIIAVCYYFVGVRRKSTSCLVIAAICAITGLRHFSDGGFTDYLLTALTLYHLVIFFPTLAVDPEFEKFSDDERRRKALEEMGSKL